MPNKLKPSNKYKQIEKEKKNESKILKKKMKHHFTSLNKQKFAKLSKRGGKNEI
jgi:hypothetical protein